MQIKGLGRSRWSHFSVDYEQCNLSSKSLGSLCHIWACNNKQESALCWGLLACHIDQPPAQDTVIVS